MSSSYFCGIPYTPSNQWELRLSSPAATGSQLMTPSSRQHHDVVPHLKALNFFVDVYNEHHTCCWPRTLFDTHVGRAAEAVYSLAESACSARQHRRKDSAVFKDSGEETEEEESKDASPAVYVNHVMHVAEQLFRAQQEKVPRAPQARRIVYHGAVPPVLRCSPNSDSIVYVLQGQIELHHRCQRNTGGKAEEENSAESDAPPGQRRHCACRYVPRADALARDVFPPFLVMAPSGACAGFVDSEAGSASATSEWQASPLVLALESIAQADAAPTRHLGGLTAEAAVNGDDLWCATYSPFSWICSPLGNAHVSSLIRSTAAVLHVPRRGSRVSRSVNTNTKTSTTAFASHQRDGGRGRRDGDQNDTITSSTELPPLHLAFDLYRTVYTSPAAQQHVLRELETAHLYKPHITQILRFGFGGSGSSGATAAGEEEESLQEVTAERLAAVYARRPSLLMRHLEATLSVTNTAATSFIADASVVKVGEGTATEGASARLSSPPRKVPRSTPTADLENSRVREEASGSCGREKPCVGLAHLALLRTAAPIARELCTLPRSTTLVSVLRKRSQQRPQGEENEDVAGEAKNAGHRRDGWPLRIGFGDVNGEQETCVAKLSSLDTLRDLAEALRRVSR